MSDQRQFLNLYALIHVKWERLKSCSKEIDVAGFVIHARIKNLLLMNFHAKNVLMAGGRIKSINLAAFNFLNSI